MQFGSIEAVVAAVQEDANAEVEKIERDLAAAVARARDRGGEVALDLLDFGVRVFLHGRNDGLNRSELHQESPPSEAPGSTTTRGRPGRFWSASIAVGARRSTRSAT